MPSLRSRLELATADRRRGCVRYGGSEPAGGGSAPTFHEVVAAPCACCWDNGATALPRHSAAGHSTARLVPLPAPRGGRKAPARVFPCPALCRGLSHSHSPGVHPASTWGPSRPHPALLLLLTARRFVLQRTHARPPYPLHPLPAPLAPSHPHPHDPLRTSRSCCSGCTATRGRWRSSWGREGEAVVGEGQEGAAEEGKGWQCGPCGGPGRDHGARHGALMAKDGARGAEWQTGRTASSEAGNALCMSVAPYPAATCAWGMLRGQSNSVAWANWRGVGGAVRERCSGAGGASAASSHTGRSLAGAARGSSEGGARGSCTQVPCTLPWPPGAPPRCNTAHAGVPQPVSGMQSCQRSTFAPRRLHVTDKQQAVYRTQRAQGLPIARGQRPGPRRPVERCGAT